MSNLLDALDRLQSLDILVVGDLILDRYTWGDAERISPEAPVLILRADQEEVRLGGAASVAGLLRALDARVTLAGVIGDDGDGRVLRKLLHEAGIDDELVLLDPGRPTTSKERLMGRAAQRHPQQILRVDRELRHSISDNLADILTCRIDQSMLRFQAVLVSDYAKGTCSLKLLSRVIAIAASHCIPVLIDPARMADFSRYRRASVLAPNRVEAELATGGPIRSPAEALAAGRTLCQTLSLEAAFVKLDSDGIAVVSDKESGQIFPTRSRSVYDVTGAGDMVLAMAGLCRGSGLPWDETASLCNLAAGLEVERLGVTPVTRTEIRAELVTINPYPAGAYYLSPTKKDSENESRTTTSKIVTLAELVGHLEQLRSQSKIVVFTNGCFDLLHVGHATYLQQARELGDALVVAVNADSGVRRLKGPGRPVINQADRASLLAALACVDFVIIFSDDTPHELLRQLRPDILVKGGTYTVDGVVGKEVVESYGGKVHVVGRVAGVSTSGIVASLAHSQSGE